MDMNTVSMQMLAMEQMLSKLYDSFMPLVSQFVNLGRAVGGLGALMYIFARVWGHMARNESIDFFPLFRPFLIGLCIMLFPSMLAALRGVTGAFAQSTDTIRMKQTGDIDQLQQKKKTLLENLPANRDFSTDEAYEKKLSELGGATGLGNLTKQTALSFNKLKYDVNQNFREWIKNLLELFHLAARLFINVLATFLLIVLSVLGPLTFGIGIFPGFGDTISRWFGNFIAVSLWVPVANIFGAIMAQIQVMMLQSDVSRLQSGAGMDSADLGYMVFLCIAIAGYVLVPTITDKLISASGADQVARGVQSAVSAGAAGAGAAAGATGAGAWAGAQATYGAGRGLAGAGASAKPSAATAFGYRAGSTMRKGADYLSGKFGG